MWYGRQARLKSFREFMRVSVGEIEGSVRNPGAGAIGCDVAKAGDKQACRLIRSDVNVEHRGAKCDKRFPQWLGIKHQRPLIVFPLFARQLFVDTHAAAKVPGRCTHTPSGRRTPHCPGYRRVCRRNGAWQNRHRSRHRAARCRRISFKEGIPGLPEPARYWPCPAARCEQRVCSRRRA